MKRKYVDPRVEKMTAPLRAADRAAEQRFAAAIKDHKQHKQRKYKQREQAMLLAAIIRRDSLIYDVVVKDTTLTIRLLQNDDVVVVTIK